MATTYSPLLRLAKPTTGELDGTWGDVVNDNITTMIEQAISGKATVAMADADQTLTTANGATDQARCMMIECTGAMTGAHNVVCPTSTKMYIVNNLTSGGFGIVLKTSGGTGVTVAAGSATIVYCDGTNVVSATSSAGATLGANTFTGDQILSDNELLRAMITDCGYTVVDKGNISGATVTFDYTGGSIQTFTATGSTVTLATSNWPPTGNLGELLIVGTNMGAYTMSFPSWIWTLADGTTTTSVSTFLAQNGTRTAFQSSGVDKILLITRDAGTTVYASLVAI